MTDVKSDLITLLVLAVFAAALVFAPPRANSQPQVAPITMPVA